MQGDNNKLRLLISTDNHLGYLEKDTIRGDDSFRAFEEVLKIAKEEQVDAIILGGDLFHENKPSRKCIHRTMELLRHYCMGDGQVGIELLSDATQNFPSLFGTANWEDPNFNIAIPVFTIHGNHDDPTGDGSLSSLDLLSTAGLLNYFGKSPTVDDITMNPILLRKGTTKLALYGLGSIRDERLHRTFLQSKVRMLRPPGADKDYFSILLFHQNRAAHSPTNHIPENFLDDFLDLIVWGHEHECLAEDQEMMEAPQRGHQVLQLGSSVHTSLSEGESKPKYCMVADIEGRSFSLKRRPLLSVRPFLIRNISLQKHLKTLRPLKEVEEYLKGFVEELLSTTLPSTVQMLPLLRLRVDYSYDDTKPNDSTNLINIADRRQYPLPNTQRFGLYFQDRLANTKDIILPLRRSIKSVKKSGASGGGIGGDAKSNAFANQQGSKTKMEDLVQDCLALNNRNTDSPLQLLPVNEFMDVVKRSVEKDDRDLIGDFVKGSLKEMRMHLLPTVPSAIDGLEGFIDDAPMDPLVMRERMDSWRSKKDGEFSSSLGGGGGGSSIEKKKTLDVISMDIDINDDTKDPNDVNANNDDDVKDYDDKYDDVIADKDDIKQQDVDISPPSPSSTIKKRATRTRATAATAKTTKTVQPSAKKVKKSWPPARS